MDYPSARAVALDLAGTVEQPHAHFGSWRVGGRIYATIPPGQTHLHIFVDEAQRLSALMLEPDAVVALHWGQKVLGVRVELALASDELVRELLTQAWSARAALEPARPRKPAGTSRQ